MGPMPALLIKYQPHYKGKGVEWGRSLLLVEHICICLLIFKTKNRKRERRERVRAGIISLKNILWSMGIGQPHAYTDFIRMPWLALTPVK
jgi:hypothetical protein